MRRLRVGVSPALAALAPLSGHGRVWHALLHELASQVHLHTDPGRRRPDVWLLDGHSGQPVPDDRPAIAVVHEASWHIPEVAATLSKSFLEHLAEATTRSTRGAYGICAPSTWSRDTVLTALGFRPDRVWVTPYGVDHAVFHPGLPRPMGLPDRFVLYAGTVHPRKNLDALRVGFADACAAGLPHTLVLVVGPAADRSDSGSLLDAATAPLPGAPGRLLRVTGGDDARLAALMAAADTVCLASLAEGFGLPALEALSCGTPVLASNRGALPEVVTGDSGVLVEPTPAGIRDGLIELLGHPAHLVDRRTHARRAAAGRTWERTASGVVRALRQAAGHDKG
jgi:glycosyltransferase involved in cell wall biosynthesis